MAKLSAHGTEIARLVTSHTAESRAFDVASDSWVTFGARYEYHYSFRSDGHILRRIVGLDVHPNETEARYRRHDWGWKLWKRLSEPKRDTRARQVKQAHAMSVAAEKRGALIDIQARPY